MHWLLILALFFAVTACAGLSGFVFLRLWRTPSRTRRYTLNVLVMAFSMAYAFVALEVFFYAVYVESMNYAATTGSQRWVDLYWHPINSLGYRDAELTREQVEGKKLVVVLGDSFTAGHGCKDYRDRFPNVLGRELGDDWAVASVAMGGWGPVEQYEAVKSYPYPPGVLVLQYYINDIHTAAEAHEFKVVHGLELPEGWVKFVTDWSYCLDWFYWRYRMLRDYEPGRNYYRALLEAFSKPEIWQTHAEELQRIVDFAERREIPLLAVIFPKLVDLEGTAPITATVARFFEERDVPVIDLAPRLDGRRRSDLIAYPLDFHPSVALHREVGELLAETIRAMHEAAQNGH